MSQAGQVSTSASPSVPTSFTTDTGTAVPQANILDVTAIDREDNNVNGIQTRGGVSTVGGALEDLEIQLTNRLQGTASVTGAITGDIITFSLGSTAAVFRFDFFVVGRDTGNGQGVGYSVQATARTDNTTATLIATPFIDSDEDSTAPSLTGALMDLVVSGNNVILRATGVAARTISYSAVGTYVVV